MKIKRMLVLLLTVLVCTAVFLSLTAQKAFADDEPVNRCGENLTWELVDGTLTISGTGEMYNYYQGDAPWYSSRESITALVLEPGITEIGSFAFYGCTGVTTLTIPEGVERIGEGAFLNCSALTDLTVPASVKTLGYGVFAGCTAVESITAPVESWWLGDYFGSSGNVPEKLKTVTVLGGSIGDYALQGWCGLESVTIFETVKTIGEWAFAGCIGLTEITIPDSVEIIQAYAFEGCSNLKTVTIGSGVKAIGSAAFSYCSDLTEITVPGSVKTLGYVAFSYCTKLKTVTLENGVAGIGERAFQNCSALTDISIPDSIISVGHYAFEGCSSLNYTAYDNALYLGNAENSRVILVKAKDTAITQCQIPYGTKVIGSNAFQSCTKLTKLEIPGSVKDIGYYAFQSCSGLTELTISEGVISIGSGAFSECVNLTTLVIPNGVKTIESSAFYNCPKLEEISIPDSLTYLGNYAFESSNNLNYHVYDNAKYLGNEDNPYVVLVSAVDQTITQCQIHEDTKVISTYAFFSCTDLTAITIPEGVTCICSGAFEYCTGLTAVTVPKTVTCVGGNVFYQCPVVESFAAPFDNTGLPAYFGGAVPESLKSVTVFGSSVCENAFYDCNGLTSVTISEGVETIGDSAFASCRALTEITIPGSVDEIGCFAFSNCTDLISVTISEGVQTIGQYAFSSCTALETVNLPSSLQTLDYGAFSQCTSLTSVTVPAGVKEIGESAFYYCESLITVVISDGVKRIGDSAFYGCANLTSVTIPGSVQLIGDHAFVDCVGLTDLYITDPGAWCTVRFVGWGSNPLDYETVKGHILDADGNEVTELVLDASVPAIPESAFRYFQNLTDITVSDSITDIGYGAFVGCSAVESFTAPFETLRMRDYFGDFEGAVPASLKTVTVVGSSILDGAISGYNDLTTIIISEGVETVGNAAFMGCTGLTSVTIPQSLETLSFYMFSDCTGLGEVVIPEGVTKLEYGAFANCTGLTTITIPQSMEIIGENAFFDCSKLEAVDLPSSVKTIDSWAFSGCVALTEIAFPSALETVGDYAFAGCTGLTAVTVPENVSFGFYVFSGCTGLESFTAPFEARTMGEYFNGTPESLKTVTVTGSSICDNAFSWNTVLESVTISESVKTVGMDAFSGCTGLTELIITEGLETIGSNAFYCCTNLTNLTIPSTLTTIGNYAFYGCTGLTTVTIPSTVQTVGGYAFSGCTGLTSATVCEGVENLGAYIFSDCTGLESFTAPFDAYTMSLYLDIVPESLKSVTVLGSSICNSALAGCYGLTNITIFEGVTTIGGYAFDDCNRLVSIKIPASVETIGQYAFRNCMGLTELTIPSALTTMGEYAFSGCTGLTDLTISGNVKSVGDYAFAYCTGLTSVTICEGVETIGSNAFQSCSALETVTFSFTVQAVGDGAFYECTGLTDVYITDPIAWCGISFGDALSNPLNYAATGHILDADGNEVTELVLDASVTAIPFYAFKNCKNLTSISIPGTVESIGQYAFSGCTGLTDVTVPETVTQIGYGVFEGCNAMESFTAPFESRSLIDYFNGTPASLESVTVLGSSICESAFSYYTGLKTVTIPGSVTSISSFAFAGTELADVYIIDPNAWCNITFMDEWDSNPLNYAARGHILDADGNEVTELVLDASVTAIPVFAFKNCNNLTSVTIPATVQTVGAYAFTGCTGLQAVTICEGVQTLGDYAFSECSGLTSIVIPTSVNTVGTSVFSGCSGLESLTASFESATMDNYFGSYDSVPASLKTVAVLGSSICECAFLNCSSLTSVTIPESVRSIGAYAFQNCAALESVFIPSTVETIGSYAFSWCTGLESIIISEGVVTIGDGVFEGCSGLTSATVPESATNVGFIVFSGCTGMESFAASFENHSLSVYFSTVPESLKYVEVLGDSICNSAFSGCYDLTTVTICEGVETIGEYAFSWCSSLASVTIPEGVQTIGERAFQDCTSLSNITIPKGVKVIGQSAFCGCTGLASVTICEGVETIGGSAFRGCSNLTTVTISEGVETIGEYAFSGCSNLTTVTIPNSVQTIGESAFQYCTELTFVTLSNSLTDIPNGMFACCSKLGTITIPESVKTIGSYAFQECVGLTSVMIPGTVENIGEAAFVNCFGLASVTIAEGVQTIGNSAFTGCFGLSSVTIPASVGTVGDSAFYGCWNLTSVTFPGNAPYIGESAFGEMTSTVYYPAGDESWNEIVSANQQYGATSLKWARIGGDAILDEDGLLTVYGSDSGRGNGWTWENNILTLDGTAEGFGVKAILFKDMVENAQITLAGDTTLDTTGLGSTWDAPNAIETEATNGNLIIYTGEYELTVNCAGQWSEAIRTAGSLRIQDSTVTLTSPWTCIFVAEGDLSISCSTVTAAGGNADCIEVHGVRDDEGILEYLGVVTITDSTVSATGSDSNGIYCDGDMTVTGSTVTADGGNNGIGNDRGDLLFVDSTINATGDFIGICTYGTLTFDHSHIIAVGDATDPNNGYPEYSMAIAICSWDELSGFVAQIQDFRLVRSAITTPNGGVIGIVAHGTPIGDPETTVAVVDPTLETGYVTYVEIEPVEILAEGICGAEEDNVEWWLSPEGELTITGSGDMADYAFDTDVPWADYKDQITSVVIEDGVTSIGDYAFNACCNLETVTIPNSVTSIGEFAFTGCNALTSITIPSSVKSIGDGAFYASGLTSMNIPEGVETIGAAAFFGCWDLTHVTIPNSVTAIGDSMFWQCSSLTSVIIPNSVTAIGERAFYRCSSLTTVVIPEGVETISIGLFEECSSLSSITIPQSVTSIGEYAFSNCTRLTSITLPGSVKEIGNGAFSECTGLTSIVIPAGVDIIGEFTFYGCSGLTSVTIPEAVYVTGHAAFRGCDSLQTVYYGGSKRQWNEITVASDNAPLLNAKLVCAVIELDAPEITDISARPTDGKPMLTWNKVEGAAKYEVYRAASKDGTYSRMYTTTNTSYTNTGATGGNTYWYKVRAVDAEGNASDFTEPVSVTCKLSAPVITVTNRASDGKPTVTWEAVSGAVKYEVYRATSKNGTYSLTYTTTATSYTNSLAVAGNTYYYKVRAIGSSSGATSAFSTVVSRTCDCAQPKITVTNRASDGKPTVTWEAVSGAVKYEVYRATSKNGTYSLTYTTAATSYTNSLAVAGNTYYYKVRAIGSSSGATSAFSTVVSRTCDCAQPKITVTNRASDGKPVVTWEAVSGAVKYEVYRATSKNGTYSLMYTTTNTSYTNTGATAGNMYYYKVRAIGSSSGATSAFSTVVSRTCDCAQPKITVTNRASDGKPVVTWEAVPGAVKYEVYRATSKNGTYSLMYTTTNTSYTNTGATAGNMYYYKVRAIGSSSGATSAFSTVVSRTCDCAQPKITVTNRASDGKPVVTWEAVPGAVKYEVYRATSKNGTYSLTYTTTGTSYVNTQAVAGNAYYYKVRAIGSSSGATSAFSTVVSRTCDCAQPVVTVSYTSSGNPKLTWKAVTGAVKYEVYRATSKDGTYSRMYTTTTTSYVNSSVTAGKTYYYKVIAYGSTSNATSAASSIVSAKYK